MRLSQVPLINGWQSLNSNPVLSDAEVLFLLLHKAKSQKVTVPVSRALFSCTLAWSSQCRLKRFYGEPRLQGNMNLGTSL